jgi:predicted ATPase
LTLWPLGEIDIARGQADEMIVRANQSGHVPTIVYGHLHKTIFELMAHKPARAAPHIEMLARLARDNEMPMYVLYAEVLEAWADGCRGRPEDAGNEMRRRIDRWRERVGMLYNPLLAARLAEIETASSEIEAALATIDQAIGASERTGQHWFDAELHRIRGEILIKQNPAGSRHCRSRLPGRHRRRSTAKGPQLRAARRAVGNSGVGERPNIISEVSRPGISGFRHNDFGPNGVSIGTL